MHVNYLAVLAATVASFALGGLWYSPVLFANAWVKEVKLDVAAAKKGNMALMYGGVFVIALVESLIFAMFLGPHPGLKLGLGAGFAAGLCWVTAAFATSYIFERRTMKLFLINGGYFTIQFTLIGLLLGVIG
ncbi:MAG TPA: DUF1761 domain-containing protein [Acidobacteriaceae bacterium]|jgi:hypothetical protein|nr:DUF1761 domain-containing protein [Acidobacteriaceae bacterium]